VATISKTSSSSYFRVVHVSTQISDTYSDINAAIEALVRTWGENPPSKHATVNAILYDADKVHDEHVVEMVKFLLSENSWFITGKTIRRFSK